MNSSNTGQSPLYPLSLNQRNIWDIERTCPDTPINNICTTLYIRGRIDVSALQKSVDFVLSKDPSLHTRITLVDRTPMQYQVAYQPEPIPFYDFTQASQDTVARWKKSFTREVMPLLDAPLYRFALLHTGENRSCLVIKLHHLISDGWTQALLCNRICQCYTDFLAGREPDLGDIPGYQTFLTEESRYLSSPSYNKDKAYWTEVFSRSAEPSTLRFVSSAASNFAGRRLTVSMPEDVSRAIHTFCAQRRMAPFSVFYMALAIYLKHIGGADRFTVGVPIFNRKNFAAKQTSGMFVSTLPFVSEISAQWTLEQFIEQFNLNWLEMLRHQRFPFSHIQSLADDCAVHSGRLFHIALSYQNSQLMESRDPAVSFSARWHYSGCQMEQLCIHLSDFENNHRYLVDYDYLTHYFSQQEIENLHAGLMTILRQALSCPDRPIGQLSILGPEEREQVINTFNRSAQPVLAPGLYPRFLSQVQPDPDRTALIWKGQSTTYGQLEEYSARIHTSLSGICTAPDTLAAILLPRTPALFGAMMGVLRAGGAFLLISPEQPLPRIRQILTQSGADVLLTTQVFGSQLTDLLPVVDVEHLPASAALPPVQYRPDALAYVVYTSGSTGTPKGVEICCRSLLNLACAMEPIYGQGSVLSVCNVGFDAFLLESACALLNGRTILLPLDEELESPCALARLIHDFGAGFLSTTPSRLSAFLKNGDFTAAMSNMECIVCGGEAFPSELLQRLQLISPARIYNQYGPSETAVAVSLKQLNNAPAITAGGPMANCRLYVLDHRGEPLPIGVYGTLYVGGICVGRGYRGAPELTAQAFSDSPFVPGDHLYNTGDIARWTLDGEIVLAGRSDRQVKLRGLRIEPQDIASCIAKHPQVQQCAVVVQQHSGQDILLAFYTAEEHIAEESLLDLCAASLPHYMIPSAMLQLESIPLTANGKINEALLPHPDLTAFTLSTPETPLQELLLSIFRRVLGRSDLGLDSDYFLFGGNSLNAMETLSEITEQTGCTLRVSDLYACRSVLRLSARLEGAIPVQAPHLTAAPAQARWPLTPIQQGIYVQSHLDPTGRTYHMAGSFRLSAPPDQHRLEQAFRLLIDREPLLRTAFLTEDDGIFAHVWPQASFALPVIQADTLEQAAQSVLAPFDLTCPPLVRAALWEDTQGSWVLLLNLHHIIGDGLTIPILLSKLDELYCGKSLSPQPLTYLDYAWYLSQPSDGASRLSYWKERLSHLPEPLELPGDFSRSRDFNFLGNTITHTITPELSQKCDEFCIQQGISPYMLFLGAFGLLLSRLSGKEDLLVGAAAAGRLLPETRTMCGPFINTLPLRLTISCDLTITDYLAAVRDEVNGMLDHQQVGLEEIVSALGMKRTLSQSPLYQIIFSQRPVDTASFSLDGSTMEYLPLSTGTARMDLWAELSKQDSCYTLHLEYATQLFLEETVAYFGRCMETILSSMLSAPAGTLAQIEALSQHDRTQLIDIPNNRFSPFLNLPIPDQFDRQLALDPDAPAVIFHGQTTTRRQLDQRACQIANLLADAGAHPGCRVGIALSRTVDLVAAVLAIWKVGGAYAPLLAHFPEQRMNYMVDVAGITHILCDEKTRPQLPPQLPCTLVSVHNQAPDTFQAVPLKETDLAEVLFTSGSTGQPKGVMMRWRSLANMAAGFREVLEQSDGPILCTTNVVFDMFNGEVVIPLSMGKPIVMADEEEMMLPWKLAEIIRRDGVRITQSTPSRVQMWLSNTAFCEACANLDMMIYGGEVVTEVLLRKAQAASHNAIQVNMYGPTEGTVYNTTRAMDYRGPINVGWPMRNNRVYVLDDQLQPVLPTAVGNLYIAGECVSAGYISRPDLTEASYLPDPFFPGQLMYRIGDVGRLRLDGSYDFLGRRDAQVKLNGQRVELDEINGAFVSQDCALQAATVPVRREDGSMELFTYYIPTPEKPNDREIRARLSKILPAYMLPSHMLPMDSLPCTPTGKIALKVLGEMAASGSCDLPAEAVVGLNGSSPLPTASPSALSAPLSAAPDNVASEGSLDWIVNLWRRVLNRPSVDPDSSFFDLGGTSLAALSVLSYYNNHGLTLSLAQFYQSPTAAGQAQLFSAVPEAAPVPDPDQAAYPRQVPSMVASTHARELGTVLLTGATGFLGSHILHALLEAGAAKVICTMRDGSHQRLMDTLSWYFGSDWAAGLDDRVEVICADIGQRTLGLSSAEYQALSQCISSIWNCAADVRHYAADSDALLNTNVTGTCELIKLARLCDIPLYHMSTTSVAGSRLLDRDEPALFSETEFHIGQNWQENLYVRSKFLAEHEVFEAARSGLVARVFRLGRLVGRTQDGLFQKNPQTNTFWLTMRGIHALGVIPASFAALPMELTPIDWCAQAAVALRNAPLSVYHLQSSTPPTAEECARAIAPDVRMVSDEEFDQILAHAPVDQTGDLLAPLLDMWTQFKSAPSTIAVGSALTEAQLDRVGHSRTISGPERLLRCFRFPVQERISMGGKQT